MFWMSKRTEHLFTCVANLAFVAFRKPDTRIDVLDIYGRDSMIRRLDCVNRVKRMLIRYTGAVFDICTSGKLFSDFLRSETRES